jgi:hypothetical protein
VKGIKMGNLGHIGGDTTGKWAIIYTSALVKDARIRHKTNERIDRKGAISMFCFIFGENYSASHLTLFSSFDLQLENWGVDMEVLNGEGGEDGLESMGRGLGEEVH